MQTPSASSKPSAKGSLLVIFLTVFIDLLGFGMVLPLLPLYAAQFKLEHEGLVIGLLMSCFSAMQFIFAPAWGRLSDRIGRRPVLLMGLFGSMTFYGLFGVGTFLRSLPLLFAARIGAGIAGATISTAQAYIADTTSLEKRGKGMALIGAAFGLGFTFGPLFGALAVPSDTRVHARQADQPTAESGTQSNPRAVLAQTSPDPGPWPGYAASLLSAVALALAFFLLPESLTAQSASAARKWLDFTSLRDALAVPSMGLLLLATFLCIFSFANFESTLSRLLANEKGAYAFNFQELCLTFAFIGLTLLLVQGGIVRRLSGRVSDGVLASTGALIQVGGFALLAWAALESSLGTLLAALAIVVSGFSFMTPSLNALISRRSDPAKQGGILGIAQSISSLARILGPLAGNVLFDRQANYPLWLADGLMGCGLLMVIVATRAGKDFARD